MHLFEEMISSETLYNGRVIDLKKDTVLLENGTSATREVVVHSGGVCVIPVMENNDLLFVKQFRYPFSEVLLELPAGKLNKGEDHYECGKRELLEETGAVPDEYTYLGLVYPTTAYLTEKIYLYIAKGLHFSEQKLDDDEFLDVVSIPLEKAFEMVMNDEIRDSKTQIGILKSYYLLKGK